VHDSREWERYLPLGLFAIGAYLLHLCDSKTSIVCLGVGLGVLASIKVPVLRKRVGALGLYILLAGAAFYVLDSIFGLRDNLIAGLGRDATLTGRTDVWRELLALKTDPIFGIGFLQPMVR
jgi:O-antigen ligase